MRNCFVTIWSDYAEFKIKDNKEEKVQVVGCENLEKIGDMFALIVKYQVDTIHLVYSGRET